MAEGEKKKLRERYNEARENMRDNKAVQWLKANRVPIGVGAGCLTFGYLIRGKTVHMAPAFNNTVAPVIKPTFNNSNQQVNFGGHMTKLVKRSSDGQLWESVTGAAEDLGIDRSTLSRHLNGKIPHIKGETFTIAGISTTG